MQTDKIRWQNDSDGSWICFRVSYREAVDMCGIFEDGKVYDVTIKPHRERRSLDANAYCWVLIDKLAAAYRMTKEEVYREYIRHIGGNNSTVCVQDKAVEQLVSGWERNGLGWQAETYPSKIVGCTNVILYYGSSTYDTEQMSRLIDMIIFDCKAQGIETLPPDKLTAMMEGWDAKRD